MEEPQPRSSDDALLDVVRDVAPDGRRRARLDDALADLGFDSLATADLAAAVEERFGVRLGDGDVARYRTVRDVADAIRRRPAVRPRVPARLGRMQGFARAVIRRPVEWFTALSVEGAHNVPREGPVIVASNHRSMLDIPVLALACPRPMVFMAKQELFAGPLRRRMWRELGAFSVDRQVADVRALDLALAVLERRDALVVYPEGTRNKEPRMLPFLRGAAWLALHAGAPIVPCGVVGTGRWERPGGMRRARVRVSFSAPIRVPREPDPAARREKAPAITRDLAAGVGALLT